MPCTSAYLIQEPEIVEVNEKSVPVWNSKTRSYVEHFEPYLVPEYTLYLSYDFGHCCGVDGHMEKFATREDAERFLDNLRAGGHPWIRYDPETIASWQDVD